MDRISEKTLIPLGIAVAAIGGGAMWMTTIHLEQVHASAMIREVKDDQKIYNAHVKEIRETLAEIKGELKRIPKGGE